MQLPSSVTQALAMLKAGGHEAYVVGGCVRDRLRGAEPADWDIATSALPEQTLEIFSAYRCVETGLRHGTVTVWIGEMPLEITTYRVDSGGHDHRHPDEVHFTPSLREDLARRDFTVNAIAYSPESGIVDPFGGQRDLAAGLLRCVGEPDRRFEEDALRLLRALRFSSVLGFSIEDRTAAALHRRKELLRSLSAERVREELLRLICGRYAAFVLRGYPDVIGTVLPEILPMVGFDQCNPHHLYDVYEHTLHALEAIAPQPVLRMTMLLHDSGKPASFTMDEEGIGHFYGHQAISERLARQIMERLKFDHVSAQRILALIRWHDADLVPTDACLRRWLNRLTEDGLRQLLQVKRADNLAQHPDYRDRQQEIDRLEEALENLLARKPCFTLRELAVNGKDLIAAGISPGPEMGRLLRLLLDAVIEGRCPNDKDALMALIPSLVPKSTALNF